MNKKIAFSGLALLLVLAGIWAGSRFWADPPVPEKRASRPSRSVSAEDVAADPGRYKGFLEIEGIVTGFGKSGDVFFLGCGDGCLSVPVRYTGKMPEPGSSLVVSGELKRQDERYIFEGKELRAQ